MKIKIAATGDSIPFGRGDDRNNNKGGYVLRTRKAFRNVKVFNLGVPGITTKELLRLFKKNLSGQKNRIKRKTRDLDLIIVDVGRNDWWESASPTRVVTNIRRIVKYLRKKLNERGVTPLVTAAFLIPNRREFSVAGRTQKKFVEEVNALLLRLRSRNFPVMLRFDKMPARMLQKGKRNDAGLHPTSKGYRRLSKIFQKFIKGWVQRFFQRKRKDLDHDDLFDLCEKRDFGTSATSADTDGDGYLDGQEIFELGTDPLNEDDPPCS